MKYLLHRSMAFFLAVLLLCSAAALPASAAPDGLPDPACVLGTTAADMLAGGGRQVRTELGVFAVRDEDGAICLLSKPKTALVEGPASRLNYADGVLYFAREGEESFDLCAYDLKAKEEKVLLKSFAGVLGQMYVVDGSYLCFSCGNAVWRLELDSGDYRLILFADGLRSFVPTGCGLLYAVGELFDYTLLADGQVVAEHVDSYYVDSENGGALVYSQAGMDLQQDLASAFGGVIAPTAFAGYDYVSLAADSGDELEDAAAQEDFELEAQRLEAEHLAMMNQPGNQTDVEPAPPDPAEADPNDPQLPPDLIPAEPEPTEPAPVEPEPVEPEPTEPAPAEPEPTEPEPMEPAPAEPKPTEPEPTEPAPVEPEPTEPEPTEPAPAEPEPTEPEPTEPAPAEPESTEPEPVKPTEPADPEPSEPQPTAPTVTGNGNASQGLEDPVFVVEPQVTSTPVFTDGLRGNITTGQQNIVRRARQVLNIQWTPKKGVGGYGYYYSGYTPKIYYSAGTTYKGIPYGMGMVYVPWSVSLTDYISAVNNPNSKFYTTRNPVTSGNKGSQYYGTDCSGFVSWCWNLSKRTLNNNRTGMASSSISTRVGTDYTKIQIGDALIRENSSWSHSRLVTDVTYKSDGVTIDTIEISEANPTAAHNGCCYSTRYSGNGLNSICSSSYAIYRSRTRNSASYTHECVVPLDGDYCTICGAGGSFEEHPEEEYLYPGIDVSYAQGTVSWQTVAPYISFAILRIGYTSVQDALIGKDSKFDANLAGCKANNIPYGIYFYAGATSVEQAIQEADAVIEYLGIMNGSGNIPALPVFYDVEQTQNILTLSDTELLNVISAFCTTIENCGLKAGVYASTNLWNNRLTHSTYGRWARWVAHWGTNVMGATKGANVWQFTNTGNLPGISTKVDMNYWMGTPGDTEHPSTAVVTQPTCTGEGMMTNVCLLCGETRQIPIPPLGHVFSGGYCLRCGQLQESADRFFDVPEGAWYTIPVYWAVSKGITVGTSGTTFSPYEECGRAQILTFLWRAAGSPEPSSYQNPFTDVTEERYYYKPVLWAYNQEPKFTTGVTDTQFGPNESCTRGQAIYYLWRAAGSPEPEPEQMPFTDVQEQAYYYKAVLWAKQNNITAGVEANCFGVNETCTRAQIVTFLYLAANLAAQTGNAQ